MSNKGISLTEYEQIPRRLQWVGERIREAEANAGRPAGSVRLLAVSKRHSSEAIRIAYAEGQRDFGENYLQELVAKKEELRDLPHLRLHMIGHLQRNKARALCAAAHAIHSVDSRRLVAALGRHRAALPQSVQPLETFVQVKLGDEPDKTGCSRDQLEEILAAVEVEPSLRLVGLMLIGNRPGVEGGADPTVKKVRVIQADLQFSELSKLRDTHGGSRRLPELSLGMSADLELAVAHGSTWVRVGSDIFGARG